MTMVRIGAGSMAGQRRSVKRLLMAGSLIALMAGAGSALAQEASPPVRLAQADARVTFNIPPQSLASAVTAFGLQSGYQVSVDQGTLGGLQTRGVHGAMSPVEALTRLLSGTGLTWRLIDARSIALEKAPQAANGAMQLGPVRVEGAGATGVGGGLGPSHLATTEGTRSYTTSHVTVGGKGPVAIREIPNSISVLTRQRMDDQNIVSLQDALRQIPGIQASPYGNDVLGQYYARGGFPLQLQVDGVSVESSLNSNFFDMEIYDRVEVQRGSAGLFQGSGYSGGSVNLARKRPRDSFGAEAQVTVGSWDRKNAMVDVTGPLSKSGNIRARVVLTGTDRDFFYDHAFDRRWQAYGIVEADLGSRTTLTASAVYRDGSRRDSWGVPAYTDGTLPSRSTFVGTEWAKQYAEAYEAYVALDHDFGSDWTLKASFDHRGFNGHGKQAYSGFSFVPRDTELSNLINLNSAIHYRHYAADVYVKGPISLLGQTHTLTFGASYRQLVDNSNFSQFNNIPGFDIHNYNYPDPNSPIIRGTAAKTSQYGIYGQARLKIADPVTVLLGGRLSDWETKSRNRYPLATAWSKSDLGHMEFTPYAGLLVDLSNSVSAYVSYSEIFLPQTSTTFGGGFLPPTTGAQYEAGVKASIMDDRLSATAAIFKIQDKNRAITDPLHPGFFVPRGEVEAKGFETELTGEVLPGWNISAGYTYTSGEFTNDPINQGKPYDSRYPEHLFKLWSNYRIADGRLRGLSFGGGLQAQSATESRTTPNIRQGSFAVVDAQIGYDFNEHVAATLTVNNIFDRTYLRRVGFANWFNYYGDPRSVVATLRTRF